LPAAPSPDLTDEARRLQGGIEYYPVSGLYPAGIFGGVRLQADPRVLEPFANLSRSDHVGEENRSAIRGGGLDHVRLDLRMPGVAAHPAVAQGHLHLAYQHAFSGDVIAHAAVWALVIGA
jgi:hypothetical protein